MLEKLIPALKNTYGAVVQYGSCPMVYYLDDYFDSKDLKKTLIENVHPEDKAVLEGVINANSGRAIFRLQKKNGYQITNLDIVSLSDNYLYLVREMESNRDNTLDLTDLLGEIYLGLWHVNIYNRKLTCIKATADLNSFFETNCILDKSLDRFLESRVHGLDRDGVKKYLLKPHNNGQSEVDFRYLDVFGCYRWVRLEVIFTSNSNGKEMFFTFKDVDSDVQEKKKNQEYSKMYGKALGNIFDSIFEIDLNTNTLYMLSGVGGSEFTREQMVLTFTETVEYAASRNIFSDHRKKILHVLSPDSIRQNVYDAFTSLSCDYLKKVDGRFQWYNATVRLFETEEKTTYLLFIKNVDDEKSKEEEYKEELSIALINAQSANKAKTRFLTNMSHDIRTPMNAIIGMTDLAKTYINDRERVLDCLDKITASSGHLLNLINDILDMSLIESGKLTLNEKETDIVKNITDLLTITRPQIEEKHLLISVNSKDLKHPYVLVDVLKINQVFMNILSNAIKFSLPNSEIDIYVGEKEISNKNSVYEFRFRDYGIGMSTEFLEKLFQPFERARTSTNSKVEGTGLGMSITKNIIDMMNGRIEVESKVDCGSTFTIIVTLPHVSKLSEEEKIKEEKFDFTGKRVLLVEDKILNMEIAKDFLMQVGLIVDEAWDGQEAVTLFKNNAINYYDAIIMDIQMPNMDGYDSTTAIRAMDRKDAKEVPIIAMTADVFTEDVKKSQTVGMNDHIAKPINKQFLYRVLKKWM